MNYILSSLSLTSVCLSLCPCFILCVNQCKTNYFLNVQNMLSTKNSPSFFFFPISDYASEMRMLISDTVLDTSTVALVYIYCFKIGDMLIISVLNKSSSGLTVIRIWTSDSRELEAFSPTLYLTGIPLYCDCFNV